VRRGVRILSSLGAALALASLVAEGAGAHEHTLWERDLVAHSLAFVQDEGDCGSQAHFDHAVVRIHPACAGCTQAASPSEHGFVAAAVAAPVGRPVSPQREELLAPSRHVFGRGPARAPPIV